MVARSGDRPEVVVAPGARLGECPVWDSRSRRLVWVDVLARQVHLTDVRTGSDEVFSVPLDIGAVVPRAAGGYVAALQDGFWVIGVGPPELIARVPEAGPEIRFNDGKCDSAGRFWAGTMAYDESPGAGALYRLGPDGRSTRVLQGVTISNGMAWSPDTRTMYFIDSATHRIDAFAFDVSTGELGDRRPLVHVPPEKGWPDGMTIDDEGGLWVALWRGSAVHRYFDGRLDRAISLPVSLPTSCAFGGAGLDELYVTSATEGLSKRERAAEPLAGALFRVRPGVRGVAPASYVEV
ncbi:MAG TPA: SMP-30/gluconolactonase/LRE family protein [Candidatus Limnocylindria bacterium]|nr:SMP-30/gluconolactonase/LRE family protein [Candidatus Limnocylindria bacterium]